MTATAVQQLIVHPAESARPSYIKRSQEGKLETMPEILAHVNRGRLDRNWYTADSVGVTYTDANGAEMYAVIHGASKLGFAQELHDADLDEKGAAKLEHTFVQDILDPTSGKIKSYSVDDLVKGVEPLESVYAVVMTREDARDSKHEMQSRKHAKSNRFGIAMSGNAKEWQAYVDRLPSEWKQVGVWIPSEIRSDASYDDNARARLLRLGGDDGGLYGDGLLDGALFVGVAAEPQQKAPEALEVEETKTADQLYTELATEGIIGSADEARAREIIGKYFE